MQEGALCRKTEAAWEVYIASRFRATIEDEHALSQTKFVTDWLRPRKLLALALLQFTFVWGLFVSLPTLAAAMFLRRGLIARAFGVEYVTRRGSRASNYRLLWRAVLTQSPIAMLAVTVLVVMVLSRDAVVMWPSIVTPAIVAPAIVALFFVLPIRSRSVADRFAGTYPVPV